MSIYKGSTKIAGVGVVDSVLSTTSTNPVQNKVVAAALEDVGYPVWTKPASWVDIRSGALGNSVYFLVGHSADYATYPVFSLQATVSSSGTYDVYVDGVKQATTASETATSLTWQTLALTTGYDVTYPANLRTHVVRVKPSSSANSLSAIKLTQNSSVEQGVLWAHFTTESAIELDYCFGAADNNKKCLLLEAVTAENDELLVGRCRGSFRNCESLQQIPALNFNNQTVSYALNSFGEKTAIKKVVIKNVVDNWGGEAFSQMGSLETIEMNNVKLVNTGSMYNGCSQLKKLPKLHFADSSTVGNIATANFLAGCTSLENFFLDLSGVDNAIIFRIGGASAARIDGLKGMTVSASAPFSSANSPQLDVSYTGMDKAALVCLFNSLPTVTNSQVCNITGAYGASALTSTDIAIAQNKGWTVTR